ncbi:hypothetical protein MXB_4259 [Myxobolus squamalis]|nr:hypothetical protein MXB_4259 [Myxobolus squamalis]
MLEESIKIMKKYNISDSYLINMNARELRNIMDQASDYEAVLIKHRRRTIKNRNYAFTSRNKRVAELIELNTREQLLKHEIRKMLCEIETLEKDIHHLSTIVSQK